MSSDLKGVRKFYNSVVEGWYANESAAATLGHYTPEQSAYRTANQHKFEEATAIYQITLLESVQFESRLLRWLTMTLIGLTAALIILTVYRVIG